MFATMKWQDWATAALGLWLAVSPWLLGYAGQEPAMVNAVIFGLAIAFFSLVELGAPGMVKEWIVLVSGLWLVFAPFALGLSADFQVTMNTMLVGVLAAMLAAWAIPLDKEVGSWWHDHITGH